MQFYHLFFFFQLEMIGSALQNSNINLQGDQNNPMIITIQYKVYPDAQGGEPQKVFISRRIFLDKCILTLRILFT